MDPPIEEPKVKKVMNKDLRFIQPDSSIQQAAKSMKENGIGSLLVEDKDKIQGIVTTKDLVYKHLAEGDGSSAEDIMTRDLVTISPYKSIEEAALIMVKKGIERLPVIEKGELVGIISTNDLIKVQPSLYLELLEGLKLGEERFRASTNRDIGQCESCDNYSENLEELNGQLLCEECREEFEGL